MDTLIIFASPNPKGNSAAILREVELQLRNRDESFELIDLYKIKYDPVLYWEELYTAGNRTISKQNLEFQQKITQAKRLVFVYSVWWNSMPAILKGFFDKVLTSHYAFRYKPFAFGIFIPVRLLKGKKAAVFLNSGAFAWISKTYQGGRAGKIVTRDTLGFCGIRSRSFQMGPGTIPDEKKLKRIHRTVKRGLRWLF